MGFDFEDSEVHKLLQDPNLVKDITEAVLADPAALNELAEDIADELSDVLEDDPEFKSQIIQAAMANDTFKKRLMIKLAKEVAD
jgi:3-methyladenine DNA glycosylase AlkC